MLLSRRKQLVGAETEFHLLDNDGFITAAADRLIGKTGSDAKKECSKSMVELNSRPGSLAEAMNDLLGKLKRLADTAEKCDMKLFYHSTYPGPFTPEMRKEGTYGIKEKIFGTETWKIAGRCVGFHFHYTLPKSTFSIISRNLKLLFRPSLNQRIIDAYNILVALDPAICTFMQSSPYYQGRLYGKDARMMFYRGNELFKVKGLYSKFQEFGALPPYRHKITSIMYSSEDRFEEWERKMKEAKIRLKAFAVYGSALDTDWSPVKINPLGTFEMRGMDMNRFGLIALASLLIRSLLHEIQNGSLSVRIDKNAEHKPFAIENNTLFIPPFEYVNQLQLKSALYGMENSEVREYCINLLYICSLFISPKLLSPFRRMIDEKRTVSDYIIMEAKKLGAGKKINNAAARELSLKAAERIWDDIRYAEKLISKLDNTTYGRNI